MQFIRYCRTLDMTLEKARILLQFRDRPYEDCGNVNVLLYEHIRAVEVRLEELAQLKQHLTVLRQKCASTAPTASCVILQALADRSCHV